MVKDKLIVALDFHTKEDALALVDKLGDSVVFYKVGMELFYSCLLYTSDAADEPCGV